MEKLPGEVLSQIFFRLLAKEVAQMRCVSKSWNALLSDPSFIKSHLRRSLQNNDEILLFFHHGFSFHRFSITARRTQSPNLELTNFIEFPFNTPPKDIFSKVIGSLNGLICFCYGMYIDYAVYIWNPSLSAMLTLPPCSFPSGDIIGNDYRFGYDPKTDDYKVVKFTCLSEQPRILPQGEVYSMRKGSWELISQSFPSHITQITDYDYVCADGHDGRLHWLGSSGLKWKPHTIVGFDLGAETFSEILLPDSILHHHGYLLHVLKVFSGKLCVMSTARNGEREVWVMNEYGVAEAWIKHHAFPRFGLSTVPYGFTSHNEFLFGKNGRFCLYDIVAAKTKTFKIMMDYNGVNKIVKYVDSLVWVIPTKHEPSKGHLPNSILKSRPLLKGLQKARKGISQLLFQRCISCSKGY